MEELGGDGGLPVGLVDENGSKIAHDVDDTENDTPFGAAVK